MARRTHWSEASEDSGAAQVREDGSLAVVPESLPLTDGCESGGKRCSGQLRLVKTDPSNNTAKDDVAAALTLGAWAMSKLSKNTRAPRMYLVVAA